MNWFQRHLNWTWALAYLLWFVINAYARDPFGILWWLSLVAAVFWLIVSGWVIKQKGRSLWWILLAPVFSPLWLRNKSLVGQSLPIITDEERRECLAYYTEEKKLRLLYEKVEQLFDKGLGKYEDAYFKARKEWRRYGWGEDRDPMSVMDKIAEVHGYFSEAAVEIVRRKLGMKPVPPAASEMSAAWELAYLSYNALRKAPMVAGSNAVEVRLRQAKTKELFEKFDKHLHSAWEKEREFRRRLKVSNDEYQNITDHATIAVDADEWLRKLEAEFP
jgi:hypothetical protein